MFISVGIVFVYLVPYCICFGYNFMLHKIKRGGGQGWGGGGGGGVGGLGGLGFWGTGVEPGTQYTEKGSCTVWKMMMMMMMLTNSLTTPTATLVPVVVVYYRPSCPLRAFTTTLPLQTDPKL